MAEVTKTAGVTAWTGAWRLPTDKRDHQRAVRNQRRKDRRDVANLRRDYDRYNELANGVLRALDVDLPAIDLAAHTRTGGG